MVEAGRCVKQPFLPGELRFSSSTLERGRVSKREARKADGPGSGSAGPSGGRPSFPPPPAAAGVSHWLCLTETASKPREAGGGEEEEVEGKRSLAPPMAIDQPAVGGA